jgi:hypothetical protein
MVRNRKNSDLVSDDVINDAEREAPHDDATLSVTPQRAETRVLQEQSDRLLELGKEGLR